MASSSCTITASSNVRLCNFCSNLREIGCLWQVAPYKTKANALETSLQFRRIQLGHRQMQVSRFARKPLGYEKSLVVSCGLSSGKNDTKSVTSEEKESNRVQIAPSTTDVHSLLLAVCDTTSIAEFKLSLHVKRDVDGKKINPPAPVSPAIQMNSSSQVPDLNGSAAATSIAISKPKPSLGGIPEVLDISSDEGLMILQSPKVGIFRRSRTIKGKRTPPSCKEKQEVKEGQVLCFIEQLGGEIPIESDVSGEVIKILREDGGKQPKLSKGSHVVAGSRNYSNATSLSTAKLRV